tara:strand:- start:82 stop:900 length:819 start_codon:yes stop_codon:yes gene_type:complete
MSDTLSFDRREVLAGLLAGATVASTVGLGACVGGDSDATDSPSTQTDTDWTPGGWATGGTAALASTYDVDFSDETCAQTCELTLGPCYAETLERQDISESVDGLPTRMSLRIVDTDCNPVEGAVVDVWHCSPAGLYSGSDAADMCTDGDSTARAARWFRGTQTTDADGVVHFDTCMPGWYPSRAVHIHFQVRVGGDTYVTSQLGFDETLLFDVFDTQPIYSEFGRPDTPNSSDNILSRDLSAYLFRWRQADDGALVLHKTITIRSSLSDGTC